MKYLFFSIMIIWLYSCVQEKGPWIITPPARNAYTQKNPYGRSVIPNGRFVKPAGRTTGIAPHPYGLTLSPDGSIAVTANSGTSPLSVTIIRDILAKHPDIQQVPPGPSTDRGILASVFMGLAIAPDNRTLYVAGGQENKVYIFDLQSGESLGEIDCSYQNDSTDYNDGYLGDLVLSKDGKRLFVVDQTNFRMVILDTENKRILHNVPVGRYPFGITLSPDEKKVYVANVGMYTYSYIRGININDLKNTGLLFPAFGYGTKEAEQGIRNDTIDIPGLGDPNAPEAFSVFTIDLQNPEHPYVSAKTKTGHLVGSMVEGIPAVGGSSPNSLAATKDYVFVSNGNNDDISVIDIHLDSVIHTIRIMPDKRIQSFRGIIPFGLAVSPDGKRLYVAESGINAIGVIDIPSFKVAGHIPAGWFPSKVRVTPDGKNLVVANAKGYGSGPNGGPDFDATEYGSYIGNLMRGSVSVIPVPTANELKSLTNRVINNNFRFTQANDAIWHRRKNNPIPFFPGQKKSPVKHIVFISKENRTYDEIFGQVKNANGLPALARYGENASFTNHAGTDTIINATVMPNHLKMASEFAISDNFYVDSDVSADGHRWLVNTYPNEWVETSAPASYGGNRNFKADSKAPGKFGMTGSAGAIYPEDYNEAGSLWEHLERHGIDFYNFGFSIMFEPAAYEKEFTDTGARYYINYPVPQPIYTRTSREYPTFNMAIPDQFRIDRFKQEFNKKWINDKDTMPSMITVIIPNDHGANDRPEAGYSFRESYMADNDLAVGRIVEFLSHTPYWKSMMIIITEDDAQNGVDHVDAHRSILMVVSPYVKRNYVSHVHYSFGSLFKTFWNILGLPYLNQYDAAAMDLGDFFTSEPDFTPYEAVQVDKRIFDPQKALDPFDKDFDWKAIKNSPDMDDVHDMMKESKERDEYRMEDREKKQ